MPDALPVAAGLAGLVPLAAELCELKRVATRPRRTATRPACSAALGGAGRGASALEVALETTADAVAAVRLGGIDRRVLESAGLSADEAGTVLRRSFDEVAGPIRPGFAERLREHLGASLWSGHAPSFAEALIRQPRAGATCPGKPRFMLDPPENHGDHCAVVAVLACLLAPRYDADPAAAFLAGMAHHLHNAHLPDSGFAGEVLLGEHLEPVIARLFERELATLPAPVAAAARDALAHIRDRRHPGRPRLPRRGRDRSGAADAALRAGCKLHNGAGRRGSPARSCRPGAGLPSHGAARRRPAMSATLHLPAIALPGEGRGEGAATGLASPLSRQKLRWETPHSLAAPGERWPIVEGIPYLRTGRDALIADALHLLDAGPGRRGGRALAGRPGRLGRHAAPARGRSRVLLRDADRVNFREAMDRLAFGPVGTYFAHRWSDPTFLSGLALAEAHWTGPARVFELACGAGHFLREFARCAPEIGGADVVFAKLWLARRFVAPTARLLCFDAAAPWPIEDRSADLLFCHDAFYFLPEKPHVAAEMRRVSAGPVLVGHAHNALADNLSSGAPLDPAGYAAMFGAPLLYDDAELTRALVEARRPRPADAEALADAAAISLAASAPPPRPIEAGLAVPPPGAALRRNPLYVDGRVRWPSKRYELEYAGLATYPLEAGEPQGDGRRPPPRAAGPARAMVARLGWGIAGCGWVARDFVGPAIQASANGTLAALYDPTRCRATALNSFLGPPATTGSRPFLPPPVCRRFMSPRRMTPIGGWSRRRLRPGCRCCARSRWRPPWRMPRPWWRPAKRPAFATPRRSTSASTPRTGRSPPW